MKIPLYEKYPDNVDSMMYTILSTMIELDKLMDNSYAQSDIKMYLKRWTRQDIYYMFVNTHFEIIFFNIFHGFFTVFQY